MKVGLAKRLSCEEEGQHQLGRLPVFHPQLADHLEPQAVLRVRLAACRLQLGLREHPKVQQALLHQWADRQENRVHQEERPGGHLEDLRQDLCPWVVHLELQASPEVKAGYLGPKQRQLSQPKKWQ